MRGPAPKRPDQRQRTNTASVGLVTVNDDTSLIPTPPADLLATTKEAWVEFWTSPLAKVVSTQTDGPALRRLFGMYDERERMVRTVKKEGRMIAGSKGQTVLNPLVREIGNLDAEIRQLEDRFGMSPLSRLRLGVVFGEAANSLASLNAALAADDEEDEIDIRVVEVTSASG